jgi:molybdopterin-guanine dinucleotide biosynthesis protein A
LDEGFPPRRQKQGGSALHGAFSADPRDLSAAGFVLAGGQSSRMGRDKALLEFAGRPLIENALSILREAGLAAFIAGAPSQPESQPETQLAQFAPVVSDREPGLGPLSGICAALEFTQSRHAIFLPVDLPLIPPSLVAFLLHHARITGRTVTVPSLCGVAQAFPAVLDRAALPALRAELFAGRRACKRAFHAAAGGAVSVVAVELLAQAGAVPDPRQLPPSYWFLNANTPQEMERVIQIGARIP